MKGFLLLLLVCFAINVHAQMRPIDVEHYRFEITLNDSTDVISAVATIRFKINQKLDTISFDLMSSNNTQPKGMHVTNVLLNGQKTNWLQRSDKLQIISSIAAGNDEEVTVSYEGIPKDGLIISTNKFGDRTFFADNWPDRARNWLPCIDDPADKASVEFIVTAPLHYQVVSNGMQVEETIINDKQKLTLWKETVALPTKIMVIGAAKFAVQYVGDTLGVPVYSWVYPQEKEKAFYDYAQAKDILPFFINNIAPYPYYKLANVQSKTIFGGMENAGCIFYSEAIITGTRRAEDLFTHEIAHQWFGDMASEKSFAHLWLSEGFATYMTDLYIGSKYGVDSMNKRLLSERAQVIAFNKRTQKPVVDSTTRNYMQLLNANSYQKGAWVLNMLRNQLGADVFMQGIRAYYKRYGGGNASTDDLRKVMEKTSGKNLQAFFTQWLYTAGHPVLQVKHILGKNSVLITVTQQQSNVFDFPLDIEVQTAKGVVKKTVQVNGREQSFRFTIAGEVRSVLLDPGVKLLFEQVQ